MTPPEHPLLRLPLSALALLYGTAVRFRNRRYDRPGMARRAQLPILSVGNLTVGGTGKTPLVAWLAESLLARGRRPAIVSRGYGGKAGRGPVVVSRGDGPEQRPESCGDEPYLMASMLRDVPVVVGSDRLAGTRAAAGLGSDVVILDDGFQHRRIARELDIVLLDGSQPFGNGRLLPAGSLREPPSALARADLVMITRSHTDGGDAALERVVRSHNSDAPVLYASHRPLGFFDSDGQLVKRPRRAFVFCGIGNPGRFRSDLEAEGVEIVAFVPKRDHQRYAPAEVADWHSRAVALGAVLLTTEKDRVRLLSAGNATSPPLLTLRIEARPFESERLMREVERALAGSRRT